MKSLCGSLGVLCNIAIAQSYTKKTQSFSKKEREKYVYIVDIK